MTNVSRLPSLLLVTLPFACSGSADLVFTIEDDDAAMAVIERSWSDRTMSLSLCEDYAAEPAPPYDTEVDGPYGWCGLAHVVRGHGRGYEHTMDTAKGIGCGGCTADVVAFVSGTFDDGSGPRAVSGQVVLESFGGSLEGDAGYELPYIVTLACTAEPACTVNAELRADGTLALLDLDFNPTTVLASGGAAICPEPPAT